MASIIPVPTTRVGEYFVRSRLVGQVQNDQLDLFRLQNQISTGQRIQLPSEDAPAALRAINLQRLIDRKGQIQTNIQANNQSLSAVDSQLQNVSGLLADLRAHTLGVADTLTNDSARQDLINRLDGAIENLVNIGNARFQDRYLFAGSRSQVQPYQFNGSYVEYLGNEGSLRSYVDLEQLFSSNIPGTEVFGGISSKVLGGDVNPHFSANTLTSTLNGGNGISRNASISVSITTSSSTVTNVIDLSRAVTVGDVARLIEEGAPAGTSIVARVTSQGLTLTTPSGTITVSEVGQGRGARELGIGTPPGAAATSTITGTDLNPAILNTTQLDTLLGTKATGVVSSAGANNDIVLTASQNGTALNGVRVIFQNNASVLAGNETAAYNTSTKTLTVQVQAGFSTARQVAAAINTEGTFSAAFDNHDASSLAQAGTNPMEVNDFGVLTTGGTGQVLDTAHGLTITNGGKTVTFDTSMVHTVEDMLNLLNGSGLGLSAEINATRTGINVRSRLNGADLTISENGGQLATQLGIRTYTGASKLAEFNRGVGVPSTDTLETLDTSKLDSLRIVARDGTTLNVNLAGTTSLQQVADAINGAAGNNTGTTEVVARLSQNGNQIELVDSSDVTTGSLVVESVPGTQAAQYLGFVNAGDAQKSSTTTNSTGDFLLSGGNVMGNDFVIQARDGTELWIDLAGAKTVDDVLQRINTNAANTGSPPKITARLATNGNGIELVDASVGTGALTVRSVEGSQAAEYLGFVPHGQTETSSTTAGSGGTYVLQSEDRNTVESDSVFNTLIRLKEALAANNTEEIGRSVARLDVDLNRVNFARADVGSRLQNLEVIDTKLADENIQLKSALSDDMDVDLVEAISSMTARQYALQASLQTAASLLQLSLLDFI